MPSHRWGWVKLGPGKDQLRDGCMTVRYTSSLCLTWRPLSINQWVCKKIPDCILTQEPDSKTTEALEWWDYWRLGGHSHVIPTAHAPGQMLSEVCWPEESCLFCDAHDNVMGDRQGLQQSRKTSQKWAMWLKELKETWESCGMFQVWWRNQADWPQEFVLVKEQQMIS